MTKGARKAKPKASQGEKMSRRVCRTLLFLDGVPALPALEAAVDQVYRATGPMEAARAIVEKKPDVVVLKAEVGWQAGVASGLPPEVRPAILAVGPADSLDARWVDEWLANDQNAAESVLRLELAKRRGQQRRRAAKRAFIDSLTGLPNRRASVRGLLKESERSGRTGGSLSLVLIDLDNFKEVNEAEGHPAGDKLLRKVGQVLRKAARGTELCGRIGGDEFALAVSAKLETAVRVGQRLADALRTIDVSASVAACERRPNEQLRQLYRRTDLALAVIKERSRAHHPASHFRVGSNAPPPYAS